MRPHTFFVMLLAGSLVFDSCTSNKQDTTTLDANRAVVKAYHEVWSNGQLPELDKVLAPDFIYHTTSGKEYKGVDLAKKAVTRVRTAFPDLKEEIIDMVAEGDKVVTRYKTTGAHQGKYIGIDSTGKNIVLYEASVYRIANGKLAEEWVFGDSADLSSQLKAKK